ncbi:hypothetical protein [Rhizobium sp. MHM7A]|uniref:hypothetical protein n=1 Tax=Rhizobium sp. MHM7A TaxID=2583233 RepID=UPI0011074251|nr:hypothetical protein [Rhizobium sp. MHM7A]TLX17190.1 hypothetical protein FFR93_07725 [Rhizobium sp. MHM7A]
MTEFILDPETIANHYAWRRQIKETLPDLEARVFALGYGGWAGCGLHYDMVKELERVIAIANDSEGQLQTYMLSTDKVNYEFLVERVLKAEWSRANKGASPTDEGAPWHQTNQEKIEKTMDLFEQVATGLETTVNVQMIFLKTRFENLSDDQKVTLRGEAYPLFLRQIESFALGATVKEGSAYAAIIDFAYQQTSLVDYPFKEVAMIVMAYGADDAVAKLQEAFPEPAPGM